MAPVTYTFSIDAGSETSEVYFLENGSKKDPIILNQKSEPFYLSINGNDFSPNQPATQSNVEYYSNIKFLNALDSRKLLFGGLLNSFESLIFSIRLNVINKLRTKGLDEVANRIEKGDSEVTLNFKFLAGIPIKEKVKLKKAIEMAFPGCKVEDTQIIDEATTQTVDFETRMETPNKHYLITYDMGGSTTFLNLSLVDKTKKKPEITNITHMTPIGGKKIDKDYYIYFLDMYFPILYTTKNELKEELDKLDNIDKNKIINLFNKSCEDYGLKEEQKNIQPTSLFGLLKKFLEDENSLNVQEKIYLPVIVKTLQTLQNEKIEDYINSFSTLSKKLNIDSLRLIELEKNNKLSEIEGIKGFKEVKEEYIKVKKILKVNRDEKYKCEFKGAQKKIYLKNNLKKYLLQQ